MQTAQPVLWMSGALATTTVHKLAQIKLIQVLLLTLPLHMKTIALPRLQVVVVQQVAATVKQQLALVMLKIIPLVSLTQWSILENTHKSEEPISMTVLMDKNVCSQWKISLFSALLVITTLMVTLLVSHAQKVESAQSCKNSTLTVILVAGFKMVSSPLTELMWS